MLENGWTYCKNFKNLTCQCKKFKKICIANANWGKKTCQINAKKKLALPMQKIKRICIAYAKIEDNLHCPCIKLKNLHCRTKNEKKIAFPVQKIKKKICIPNAK